MSGESKRTPVAVGAFLAAWEALCVAMGRRSLTAGGAAAPPVLGLRRLPLAEALTDLGYPEALTSGARLGAALRRLRGVRDEQGRYLERSRGAKGSIWYVVGPTAPAAAAPEQLLEDAAELAVYAMGGAIGLDVCALSGYSVDMTTTKATISDGPGRKDPWNP